MKKILKKNGGGFFMAAVLVTAAVLAAALMLWTTPARAASGTVYSCTINRAYRHPVSGVIEDSGGEQSYSIGQGMVEGCVYPNGILEVTDSGEYYLTIRMSLMDYTSGHTFWVQTWGEDGWSVPAAGITGTGTDSNGSTADICIRVPNENCIVRGAMYVDPMGRDVYWYMYPGDFTQGNNTDMNATMVTSASGSDRQGTGGQQSAGSGTGGANQSGGGSGSSLSGGGSISGSSGLSGSASNGASGSGAAGTSALQSTANGEDGAEQEESEEHTLSGLDSSIGAPQASSADASPDTESVTNGAQGLSLSTAGETEEDGTPGGIRLAGGVLTNTLSVLIPGVILIAVAAVVVWFFRKNWKRWGGAPDDEEY